jgi:maleylacetoacetate isomerase
MLTFYDFFRSSAAWRVRIALAWKGIAHESVHVHLFNAGGEHRRPAYRAVNPQARVPTLAVDGRPLGQSLAILEYLEETHPTPPLLPSDAFGRAAVRAMALAVAADIHPLQNLRVREYVEQRLGQGREAMLAWCVHWIEDGLGELEAMARRYPGPFLYGDAPTIADCCLVPQLFNLRLFGDRAIGGFERLLQAEAAALQCPAFRDTAPDRHPNRDAASAAARCAGNDAAAR